jgi:hypothetical protein
MDKLELSTDLVNAIMQYLGKQPFQEVAGIINGIQQQAIAQGAKPAEPAEAPAQ